MINLRDSDDGNTALNFACKNGVHELVTLFLDNGAQPKFKNEYDRTGVMLAALNNHSTIIKILLEKDENLAKDDDQEADTALHLAADKGNLDAVETLWFYNADIHARNHIGDTALDKAARNGHLEVVKFLIEKDAIIDPKDKSNKTPLMHAAENGHFEIVNFLLENGAQPYSVTKEKDGDPVIFNKFEYQTKKGMQNTLELAIAANNEKSIKAILLSDYWDESLRNCQINHKGDLQSPFRSLVEKFPELAIIAMNRCVTKKIGKNGVKEINFNFEFVEDMYDVEKWYKLRGLEAGKIMNNSDVVSGFDESEDDGSGKKMGEIHARAAALVTSPGGGGSHKSFNLRRNQSEGNTLVIDCEGDGGYGEEDLNDRTNEEINQDTVRSLPEIGPKRWQNVARMVSKNESKNGSIILTATNSFILPSNPLLSENQSEKMPSEFTEITNDSFENDGTLKSSATMYEYSTGRFPEMSFFG